MTTAQKQGQKQLVDYLNQTVDPYDFGGLINDWRNSGDVDLTESFNQEGDDLQVEDLSEGQLTRFTKWLKEYVDKHPEEVFDMGAEAPSYFHFRNAKALPSKSWLIHYTSQSPFTSFKHGRPGNQLGLTTWFRNRLELTAKCPENASGELGLYETLYGFSFDLSDTRHFGNERRKYGQNAVIFQHDYAIKAYHVGDNEYQCIFPLCGEYNAIPIYGITMAGGGWVTVDNNDIEFESNEALLQWAESRTKQRTKKKKQLAGFSSTTSRWLPGITVRHGTFDGMR